jgi:hypothetical protein
MRLLLTIVLISAAWSVSQLLPERTAEPAPEEASAGLAAVWQAVPGVAPAEPAPDPVVHCVGAEEVVFVRQSACVAAGGRVDEPLWAQLP